MGSYTTLSIDNYAIHISKSDVDPYIMTIFTEQDKIIFRGKQHPENDEEIIFQYKVQIDKAIDRLTVMGFTLEKSEKDFNISKNNLINEIRESLKCDIESIADIYQKEFDLLEQSSFEDFTKALQNLRNKSIDINEYENLDKFELSDLELYIADSLGWFFTYPASDWRYYLRVFFEYCPKDSFVIQDVTDIAGGDECSYEDNLRDESISFMDDYQINLKTIILTEGTSDIDIIKRSLAILYPHLTEYYSFMDFKISNISGGASSLVSQIKAFIGVGIRNKIIAIFDNDTAAFDARKGLINIKIPDNIIVKNYPDIELANNYPTLGATGEQKVNINGLACSIEMYFGKDILENDNGELTHIQWKGYNQSLDKYQGELLNKKNLQNKYYKKLDDCETNPSHVENYNWNEMRLLLQEIFNA